MNISMCLMSWYQTLLLDDAESSRVPLKPELMDNNTRCILEYQPNNNNDDDGLVGGNKTNTLVISYDVERDNEENEIQVQTNYILKLAFNDLPNLICPLLISVKFSSKNTWRKKTKKTMWKFWKGCRWPFCSLFCAGELAIDAQACHLRLGLKQELNWIGMKN